MTSPRPQHRATALGYARIHPLTAALIAMLTVGAVAAVLAVTSPTGLGQDPTRPALRTTGQDVTLADPLVAATTSSSSPASASAARTGSTTPQASSSPVSHASAPTGALAPATADNAAHKTLFGASLNLANGGSFSSALASQDARFGHLGIVRVFYPGFPASFASHPQLMTRPSIISFKLQPAAVLAGTYDAKLKAWFASAPTKTNVYWSYWHEPENDGQLNLAQYRAAWAHISALSRTAHNPDLHATLILMGWTLRPHSGRNWKNYYAGSSAIDVLAWDVYNTGAKKGTYGDPANLYGTIAALSKSLGKPWGLAETASTLVHGDNGSGRARWLTADAKWLQANGASFASYFDTEMPGGDYRLRDQPSIASWRNAASNM